MVRCLVLSGVESGVEEATGLGVEGVVGDHVQAPRKPENTVLRGYRYWRGPITHATRRRATHLAASVFLSLG